jgi:hypothetical protein
LARVATEDYDDPRAIKQKMLKEARELLKRAEVRAEQLALEGSRDHSAAWLTATGTGMRPAIIPSISSRSLDDRR